MIVMARRWIAARMIMYEYVAGGAQSVSSAKDPGEGYVTVGDPPSRDRIDSQQFEVCSNIKSQKPFPGLNP
jgi:hypothetical protein